MCCVAQKTRNTTRSFLVETAARSAIHRHPPAFALHWYPEYGEVGFGQTISMTLCDRSPLVNASCPLPRSKSGAQSLVLLQIGELTSRLPERKQETARTASLILRALQKIEVFEIIFLLCLLISRPEPATH